MREVTTNLFFGPVGTVQEAVGYFSTAGVECAVVTEEHRGRGLVYEFLNYTNAVFSSCAPPQTLLCHPLTADHRCSPASQEPAQLPWRTWRYLTHLGRGGVWRPPKSSGQETWYSLSPVLQLSCLTGKVMMEIVTGDAQWLGMSSDAVILRKFGYFNNIILRKKSRFFTSSALFKGHAALILFWQWQKCSLACGTFVSRFMWFHVDMCCCW